MKFIKTFEKFSKTDDNWGWGLHFTSNSDIVRYFSDTKKWLYDAASNSGLEIENWDSKPSRALTNRLDSEFHSNKYSTVYRAISNKLGSDERASKYLLELGIDGHIYNGYKGEDNWIIYDTSRLNKEVNESIDDNGDIFDQLNQFIQSTTRNKWLGDNSIKIYVRKSQRNIMTHEGHKLFPFLDLANIEVTEQGIGTFTNFLTELLKKYPDTNLYVESILNPKVESILKKFGFVYKSEDQFDINMYLLKN